MKYLLILIALLSVGCTDVGYTFVSAVCNDTTSPILAFQHTEMSPAQENEMARREEARLCTDHGGVFLLHHRHRITDYE